MPLLWIAAVVLAFLAGWLLPPPELRPARWRARRKLLERVLDDHDENVQHHAENSRVLDRRQDLQAAIQMVREAFRKKRWKPPPDDQVREALRCRRLPR